MANQLSAVPPARRRHIAATLGLFAMLFVTVGAVAATGGGNTVLHVVIWVSFVIAALLALMAWGVLNSIRLDAREARLDAEIAAALTHHDLTCGCGSSHEVAGPTCAHDGAGENCSLGAPPAGTLCGAACGGDCDTCSLAALRPSPTATRAERQAG